MRNRVGSIRLLLLVLAGAWLPMECVRAQMVNTHSPYSRFGIGLQEHQAYSGLMGLGGVSLGVAQKSAVNAANPASYGRQDSMTFLFDFGVQGGFSHYRTPGGGEKNAGQAGVQHLAMQFPLARWAGMALGFQPYSRLGYDVVRYEKDLRKISEVGRVRYHHTGKGGLNEAFIGVGFVPHRYMSVGLNLHYRFGSIDHGQDLHIPSNATYSEYRSECRYVVKALVLRGGIQARIPLDSTWGRSVVLGATVDYNPYAFVEQRIEASTTYRNSTMVIARNLPKDRMPLQLPLRYAAGAVYESSRWFGGVDFIYEQWNSLSWFGQQQGLKPSFEVRFGGQYTPDAASLRSYAERISYRLGAVYSELPMRINGERVRDVALTVGLGLPVGWRRWVGSIAVEVGRRGGFGKDLVNETYCNIHLGVSFVDTWFFKRKYD